MHGQVGHSLPTHLTFWKFESDRLRFWGNLFKQSIVGVMNTHNFWSLILVILKIWPLKHLALPPFLAPILGRWVFSNFRGLYLKLQEKIFPWKLIFMMTGTQIIGSYCQKWYTTFTFYVTGPQKPTFVLMWGAFVIFSPFLSFRRQTFTSTKTFPSRSTRFSRAQETRGYKWQWLHGTSHSCSSSFRTGRGSSRLYLSEFLREGNCVTIRKESHSSFPCERTYSVRDSLWLSSWLRRSTASGDLSSTFDQSTSGWKLCLPY